MVELVAILEDDGNRIDAMQKSLDEILPEMKATFFENAQEMIAWLGEHLGQVGFVSLDHDLPLRGHGGQTVDCGTGRQVADYLASIPPTCPVIVHSSNDACAAGMFFTLERAGWPIRRVYPRDDEAWIGSSWAEQVRQFVCNGWIRKS